MKSTGSPCAYYDPPGGGFNGAAGAKAAAAGVPVHCLFIDGHFVRVEIRNPKHEIRNNLEALNSKQKPSGEIVAIGEKIAPAFGVWNI
jgi:hypothetical protein